MVPTIELGPWRVLTHDLFTVIALTVGLVLYYRDLRRRGWLDERIVTISIAAIAGGLIGARVITAWEHLEYYSALDGVPLTVAIEHSGKILIGALAGGYLGIAIAKRALGYTPLDRRRLSAREPGGDGHRSCRLLPVRAAAWDADRPAVGHQRPT